MNWRDLAFITICCCFFFEISLHFFGWWHTIQSDWNTPKHRGTEGEKSVFFFGWLLEEKVFTVDYSKGTQKKNNWSGEKRAKLSTLSFSSLVYPMRKKKGRREFIFVLPLFAPSFHHSRRVSLSAAFGWKRESQYGLTSVNGSYILGSAANIQNAEWEKERERENRLYRETDESSLKRHSPDSSLFHISRSIAIVYAFEMSGKCFSLNRRHIFIPTGSTDLLPWSTTQIPQSASEIHHPPTQSLSSLSPEKSVEWEPNKKRRRPAVCTRSDVSVDKG